MIRTNKPHIPHLQHLDVSRTPSRAIANRPVFRPRLTPKRRADELERPDLLPPKELMDEKLGSEAQTVLDVLKRGRHKVYLVGSWVREAIRNPKKIPKKVLVATNARPRRIIKLFQRVADVEVDDRWAKYGNVNIIASTGKIISVSTIRKDGPTKDHRHPQNVTFTDNIVDHLGRVDFTCDAIAYDPFTGQFIDPFEGSKDIRRKRIKTVGDPKQRFTEDPFRCLRGICLAAELGFEIVPGVKDAIRESLSFLLDLSAERRRDALLRILQIQSVSRAFNVLVETGTLHVFSKHFHEAIGVVQGTGHEFKVLQHLVLTCEYLPTSDPILRLAGLLHDIGKPKTIHYNPKTKSETFPGHEKVGADMAQRIMRDLKFGKKDIERVDRLVRHHKFAFGQNWTDKRLRFFILNVGEENIQDLILLRRADHRAHRNYPPDEEVPCPEMDQLQERILKLILEEGPPSKISVALRGEDIMEILNYKQSERDIGRAQHLLRDRVLENPQINNRTDLRRILLEHFTPLPDEPESN